MEFVLGRLGHPVVLGIKERDDIRLLRLRYPLLCLSKMQFGDRLILHRSVTRISPNAILRLVYSTGSNPKIKTSSSAHHLIVNRNAYCRNFCALVLGHLPESHLSIMPPLHYPFVFQTIDVLVPSHRVVHRLRTGQLQHPRFPSGQLL